MAVQFRPLMERLIGLIGRLPRGDRIAPRLMTAYLSSRALLSWRILLPSTVISLISWFGECVAFYFVLRGLGEPDSYLLLLQATFVFAASTLFGLISFLPGGLGVTEAGMLALLATFATGVGRGGAAAATFVTRACTLWFAVAIGLAALMIYARRPGGGAKPIEIGDDSSAGTPAGQGRPGKRNRG